MNAPTNQTNASTIAIHTGTFDPFHHGHNNLVRRAADLFDEVVVAIGRNPGKKTLLDLEQRLTLASTVLADLDNVSVESYDGLTVEFAKQRGARVILRGVRNAVDFDYELQMEHMNHQMAPDVETVYLGASQEFGQLSSTLVRDIASHRGDVLAWVHPAVNEALQSALA